MTQNYVSRKDAKRIERQSEKRSRKRKDIKRADADLGLKYMVKYSVLCLTAIFIFPFWLMWINVFGDNKENR